MQKVFSYLEPFRCDHKCDRQTDRQTDRTAPLATDQLPTTCVHCVHARLIISATPLIKYSVLLRISNNPIWLPNDSAFLSLRKSIFDTYVNKAAHGLWSSPGRKLTCISAMTYKPRRLGQTALDFGLWSEFISRSVHTGVQVSMCSSYATLVNTRTHRQLLTGYTGYN